MLLFKERYEILAFPFDEAVETSRYESSKMKGCGHVRNEESDDEDDDCLDDHCFLLTGETAVTFAVAVVPEQTGHNDAGEEEDDDG